MVRFLSAAKWRVALSVALATVISQGALAALAPMSEDELSDVSGQALLGSERIDGVGGSGHTFYRMLLDAKIEFNMNIDSLELGCGGYNEATVSNACDIDIDYIRLMGLGAGQPGADGAGDPVVSNFKMVRPSLEIAVKEDNDPTRREIIGIKLGAAQTEGYMGIGRYDTSLPGCDANANEGASAFACHRGINRVSGNLNMLLNGEVFGCFELFGCTPNPDRNQQELVAVISDQIVNIYGTRINRLMVTVDAISQSLPIDLTVSSNINQHLRMAHGFAVDPSEPQYAVDDFFLSFQREQVRWPTYNKNGPDGSGYSYTANAGWWMNVPLASAEGLKAYGVAADAGALFIPLTLNDPDIGQRPPDNCYGSLDFC